jgi:hypothetical protein
MKSLLTIALENQKRFETKFMNTGKCWEWIGSKFPNGYGQFHMSGRPYGAHRVAYLIYTGDIPDGLLVCHRCDNNSCVNPLHLFVGTAKDNMLDMMHKGRQGNRGWTFKLPGHSRGENNQACKLTPDEVRAIRKDIRTQGMVAQQYKISQTQVSHIKLLKSWRHLEQ